MKKDFYKEIKKGIYWVGVKDWNRKLFDSLIPLSQGTSYNSYLICGNEKKALIDTVQWGFEKELEDKISSILDLSALDYLIMNHAEPDHSGSISYILSKTKVNLITSEKGAKYAQLYFKVSPDRIKIVKDNETISLGNKTLRFIEAPMLHWPETMFTYLIEDKILFPCDFFGAHTTFGLFEEDNEELLIYAKRYFGEIMMPFRSMGKKALEKIKDIEIEIIAPSHGCIYTNPSKIINLYNEWNSGITKEKVIVVYVTMWGSTKSMIDYAVDTLLKAGLDVVVYDLSVSDVGEIIKDLVDARAIVLGAPTVLGSMHPLAITACYILKLFKPPLQYGMMVSSYGWGPAAVKQASEILASSKIEMVGTIEVNGPPSESDYDKVKEYTLKLIEKIKS